MIKIMKNLQLASWITFLGGLWVIWMGIKHFPMAYEMAGSQDFAGLAPNASDFLILLCLCLGILLIFAGILSLYFSRKLRLGDKAAQVFFLCEGILFLARTLLELMHPVAVPEPNHSVLVLVFLTSLIFLIPVAMTRIGRHGELEDSIASN